MPPTHSNRIGDICTKAPYIANLHIVLWVTLSSSHHSDSKTIREGTEVFYGVDKVMDTILQFLYRTDVKIDACVDYTRPSLAINIQVLREAFLDAKRESLN